MGLLVRVHRYSLRRGTAPEMVLPSASQRRGALDPGEPVNDRVHGGCLLPVEPGLQDPGQGRHPDQRAGAVPADRQASDEAGVTEKAVSTTLVHAYCENWSINTNLSSR